MVLGGLPDSPKPGVVRTHALEQVTALEGDLPWSVLGPGAPVSLHGDNLDLALQNKLNSMNKQVTHLLRGRDPGEELLGDHRREGVSSFQDRYFKSGGTGFSSAGGGGGGYARSPSAAQRKKQAQAGASPRMQRLQQRVAEEAVPDLAERVYQDLESGRLTMDDALRMMELHGTSWWGVGEDDVRVPAKRPASARWGPGQSSFASPTALDNGHGPEAFDGCRRCGVLQQQVKAISQSLVGLGARILHWLPTAGLTDAQQIALKTMVLDYSQPCAHVDRGVARLVKELLDFDSTQGPLESTINPQADKTRALPSFGFEMASSPSSPSGSPTKSLDFTDLNLGLTGLNQQGPGQASQQLQHQLSSQQLSPQPDQQQQQQQLQQQQQQQQQHQKRSGREQTAIANDFLQRYGFQHPNEQKKTKRGSITSGFTTPLHVAVERCEADAVGALVACGAKVTEVDSRGLAPLVLAHKINSNGSHAAVIAALQDGLEAVVDGRR